MRAWVITLNLEIENEFKEYLSEIIKDSLFEKYKIEEFKGFFTRVVRVKGIDKGLVRAFISFRDKGYA